MIQLLRNIINWFAIILCPHRLVHEGWAFQQQRIRWCTNCNLIEYEKARNPGYFKLKKKDDRIIKEASKVDLDNE